MSKMSFFRAAYVVCLTECSCTCLTFTIHDSDLDMSHSQASSALYAWFTLWHREDGLQHRAASASVCQSISSCAANSLSIAEVAASAKFWDPPAAAALARPRHSVLTGGRSKQLLELPPLYHDVAQRNVPLREVRRERASHGTRSSIICRTVTLRSVDPLFWSAGSAAMRVIEFLQRLIVGSCTLLTHASLRR